MDVDDDVLDTRCTKPVQHMIDQRLARDLDERLGPSGGQRAHPLAEASGHNHRCLRHIRRDFGAEP